MIKQATVLLVEDSPTQAKRIAALVSCRGDVDVIVAEDGLQALRMVDAMQPDLVVLDVNLPNMNGFQVCRRLKRDPDTAHIPIAMLTSAWGPDEIKQGVDAGADEYIQKNDFAPAILIATLEAYGLVEPDIEGC